MVKTVHVSIRSWVCGLTETAAQGANDPSLTEWLTLLLKVKVGHMTLLEQGTDETCSDKVISCVKEPV